MSYSQEFNQDIPQRLIKSAWESNRLSSAYLFFGPEETGKLSLARSLAKTVNCQARSFPPCLTCSSCIKIEKNIHPDVHYIEKENSNFIKIEQIHQMQREINLLPFEGERKVFIILNAEDLTPEATNSLLKTLEEPPGDSLIILLATDLKRIFPTVISRCQKVRFGYRAWTQAEVILQRDYRLDEVLSHFLAFAFEGRLDAALRFKDRDILREKNRIIRQFVIRPHLPSDRFDVKDKERLSLVLRILLGCLRDIYFLKMRLREGKLINEDIREELSSLTDRFDFDELEHIMAEIANSLEGVRQNINPRLLMDNLRLLWRK